MAVRQNFKSEIEQSSVTDWEFMDTPETWVLKSEDLVIEEIGTDGFGARASISQPGFASLPNGQNDERTQVRIKHKGVPVDQLPALSLDGHRIMMIQPQTDHSQNVRYLSNYEAKLSEIMSQDDFMNKQGGTIDVQIR